jgi:hypothetical protein
VAHVEDVEWWSSNSLRVCVLSLHLTIAFPLSQKKLMRAAMEGSYVSLVDY